MRIEALIERMEKLDGPDREVDAWIGYHTNLVVDEMSWREKIDRFGIEHAVKSATSHQNVWSSALPAYSASLDAVIALVEKVLPGWYWRVGRTSLFPNGWAYISRTHPSHCDREDEAACADGKAANPAIALLLALLRALQSGDRS